MKNFGFCDLLCRWAHQYLVYVHEQIPCPTAQMGLTPSCTGAQWENSGQVLYYQIISTQSSWPKEAAMCLMFCLP